MPCDTRRLRVGQTEVERRVEIESAVRKLEEELLSRRVSLALSQDGAVAFLGWDEASRSGVTDVCAFLRLQVQGSMALAEAIAMAESQYGVQVNEQTVRAGVHSHDGGRTWHGGH